MTDEYEKEDDEEYEDEVEDTEASAESEESEDEDSVASWGYEDKKSRFSKEMLAGLINGLLFAVVAGVVAYVWFQDLGLGLVIAAAMLINLVVAGLAGITIPIALDKLDIDPATSSTVFLTTVTDVIGFFTFLALAAVFLL